MNTIVISQPMFFPWIGLFEQVFLSDIFVHYDDVQLPQGRSFISRVQVKTPYGVKWLTAPLKKHNTSTLIFNAKLGNDQNWKIKHKNLLRSCYSKALFFDDMMDLVEEVYKPSYDTVCELNIQAIELISSYLEIQTNFLRSSSLDVSSSSTEKLLNIVKLLNGDKYVTGHGAKNYFNHELFEEENISVEYMNYEKCSYDQLHGEFTPYVSVLDAIANLGKDAKNLIKSTTTYWKDLDDEY